jgi:hypothetical protein
MPRVVEFLTEANDYGDTGEFIATGVRRMFMLSPSIVRVTFVHKEISYEGAEQHRVSAHMDMDIAQAPEIFALIAQGLAALAEQPTDAAAPTRRSVAAH